MSTGAVSHSPFHRLNHNQLKLSRERAAQVAARIYLSLLALVGLSVAIGNLLYLCLGPA